MSVSGGGCWGDGAMGFEGREGWEYFFVAIERLEVF